MAIKKYTLTDAHRAQLTPWADRWIANALSTARYTPDDHATIRDAVTRLYQAAGLVPPPPSRIIIVPSPAVARFAGGFAAAIWYLRRTSTPDRTDATEAATRAATRAATWDATWDATGAATRAATWDATWVATDAATQDATEAATRAATWAATRAATDAATEAATGIATWDATDAATQIATRDATQAATRDATWAATDAATRDATDAATRAATGAATRAATRAATGAATQAATRAATQAATGAATDAATEADSWYRIPVRSLTQLAQRVFGRHAPFALGCAQSVWSMWAGGNHWSGTVAYLSFFRHVARLPLDYTKWESYETLAQYGPRVMHAEFCLVCERPVRLTVDDQSRPHAEHGPFCEWSDGTALYAYHGVRVPGWIMDRPQDITLAHIAAEENAEIRRVLIERYGPGRYLMDVGATPIHADEYGTLYRLWHDEAEDLIVRVRNSTPEADGTIKEYTLRVDAACRPLLGPDTFGEPQPLTARNAVASTFGLRGADYAPALET